jgi:predicted alpha/beta hydrolase
MPWWTDWHWWQARGVISDWAFTARTGRFPQLHGFNVEAAVSAVRTPVLAVSLERDQYTPAPTVDHLVNKLAAAPVQREHHDGEANHFTWARSPGPVADRVITFATSLPTQPS